MSFKAALQAYKKGPSAEARAVEAKVQESPPLPSYSPVWTKTQEFLRQIPSSTADVKEGEQKHEGICKIVILLIIVNDLPNEHLWRIWLNLAGPTENISILIHAKERDRIQSPWVRERLSRCHFHPKWGSLELTKTMVCLLHEAYTEDPTVDHFIFASESCLPLQTPQQLCSSLSATERRHCSWMLHKDRPNNGYSRIQQFDVLHGRIPDEHRYKADQWVCISHKHAHSMFLYLHYLIRDSFPSTSSPTLPQRDVQHNPIFSMFQDMRASDEMFFPTVLSLLQLLPSEIVRQRVTFAEWSEQDAASPTTFTAAHVFGNLPSLAEREDGAYVLPRKVNEGLAAAVKEGVFFFRKLKWPAAHSASTSPAEMELVERWWHFLHRHADISGAELAERWTASIARLTGTADDRSEAERSEVAEDELKEGKRGRDEDETESDHNKRVRGDSI